MTKNNFDFLRIAAAIAVIISHIAPVHGGFANLGDLGTASVFVFFAISGFLVMASWEHDPNTFRFLARRVLRIFPGLIVVVVIATLLIGPSVTTLSLNEYFGAPGFRSYLRTITLCPVASALPGVFDANPLRSAVNASLWTLPFEMTMYLTLGFVGTFGFLKTRVAASVTWIAALLLVTFTWFRGEHFSVCGVDHYWVLHFGTCFAFGALIWIWKDRITFFWWALIPVIVIATLLHVKLAERTFLIVALPYAVLSFATKPLPFLRSFGRFGDFSYGTYIYGFLMQQTIMRVWPSVGVAAFFVLSLVLPIAAGAVSWFLIEKPALSLKRLLKSRKLPAWEEVVAAE
jgi:peptidoglycan/LPS O-acetylase OafA/YrhL